MDPEETKVQEERKEYFMRKGDQHFKKNGRGTEISIDLVLQVRTKISENKVTGPEDAVASEIIKQLPQEKIASYENTSPIDMWEGGDTKFLENCETCVSAKFRRRFQKNGIRSCTVIALTSVMSMWYASCTILRLEEEKESIPGSSCAWAALTASVVNIFRR